MSTPHISLPPALIEAVKTGRVVLFLGAGASLEARDGQGKKAPSTKKLTELLSAKFLGEENPKFDLQTTSEMASLAGTDNVVFQFIKDILVDLKPTAAHALLPVFRWHTIATTNYDTLIEDSYAASAERLQNPVVRVKNMEAFEYRLARTEHPLQLIKLHGCIDHVHDKDIPLILNSQHYERFSLNRDKLYNRLLELADELPFLFVGYSLADAHVANMIHRLERIGARPEYYVVAPEVNSQIEKLWSQRRIVTIKATFSQFMKQLDREIPAMFRDVQVGSSAVPHSFRKHLRKNTDASDRLTSSLNTDLLHVHDGMATEEVDPKLFYRGYDRGFRPIQAGYDVYRKVVDDAVYSIAEGIEKSGQRLELLTGAGGSGKTIALKRVIWELATGLDCLCVWARDSAALNSENIREIYDLTGKHLIIGFDDVLISLNSLKELFADLFQHQVPATIVGTARSAAWNTMGGDFEARWSVNSYRVGKLSQSELRALLGKLQEHQALGVLSHLTDAQRLSALEYADRHLLVALHEVTSGKPFEEIVLNEYESIKSPQAKGLYLDVCTLNQFEVPARAGVVKRITGIPFSQYKDRFFDPLEEVVLTQQNRYTGDYEYTARHPKVAELVFKQVLQQDQQRVEHLQRFLEALDPGFRSDNQALYNIVRARNVVTLIKDIGWGREFYRLAAEVHVKAPFVWQHRGLFELRHRDGDLAKAAEYVELALQQDPDNQSFKHTLAEVNAARARIERNVKAKNVFRRKAVRLLNEVDNRKSSYADYSFCKLKLDELKEFAETLGDSEQRALEFAELGQDVNRRIDAAKSKFPDDPEILKLEANLLELIDQEPQARVALEKAWKLGVKGTRVAIQLSRKYAADGDHERAIDVLKDALSKEDQDRPANLEIAKRIIETTGNIGPALMHLSRSYSQSDRSYEGRYWHAQALFALGEGESAMDLFGQVHDLAPAEYLSRSDVFKTPISKVIGLKSARIVSKQKTYLFVRSELYPDNIFVHSHFSDVVDWDALSVGERVQLRFGFNRAGPTGYDLTTSN